MIETLKLEVGDGLNVDSLLERLCDFSDELTPLLTADVSSEGHRATAVSDSMQLERVEKTDTNTYSLFYHYEWSAFYGCRGADDSGARHSEIQFTYADGMARFVVEIEDERGTFEEL